MPYKVSNDLMEEDVYLAGERVAAGLYREIAMGYELRFETEDYLPATLDGRVAEYVCVRHTWEQIQEAHKAARPVHAERSQ